MSTHVYKPIDKTCLAEALSLIQGKPADIPVAITEPARLTNDSLGCSCAKAVDLGRLEELRAQFGDASFTRFVQLFLADAHRIVGRLADDAGLPSRELRTLSHNLRSASGFLGLQPLSRLAASIECSRDANTSGAVGRLPALLAEAEDCLQAFVRRASQS
jgi:HPt (histidine-containing phosphotransfer) domain-containing protein